MVAVMPDTQADFRADRWGIQARYLDSQDRPRVVPEASVARLRELLGEPPADLEDTAPLVRRPGARLPGRYTVALEDGGELVADGALPPDVPLGYHTAADRDGRERRLIVSPGVCARPEGRQWGWVVQLYAARSRQSWGIGDLGDLRTIAEAAQQQGAGFLLINPLHAVAPTVPQQPSPYYPSTRRFRNPIYLRVDGDEGRHLGDADRIDRDAIWPLKRDVLRRRFRADDAEFTRWRDDAGPALDQFATWCALAEVHGPNWHDWPEALRHPDAPAVAAFAAEHADDVAFHTWLQWRTAVQLEQATQGLTVIQDLPIGVDPAGADAWAWQDVLAQDVGVGAPPDAFNTAGQDWGLPPFHPSALRQADYQPFVDSIRATIAGAGGLRIDHAAGLFRLWWVPRGSPATEGGYVRYPADDLLAIVALESVRAGAVVVGEDLGTVEDGVREALTEHGILTYRLLWFEEDAPPRWPASALGAVTTHDLPTVAGLWSGADAAELDGMGRPEDAEAATELREHLAELAQLDADATPVEAVDAAYRTLATSPCALLAATLEDAVAAERRPNVPGTTERDNWSIPLPLPLEDVLASGGAHRLARILRDGTVATGGEGATEA